MTTEQSSAIFDAVRLGRIEIASILLQANPSALRSVEKSTGNTLYHSAARSGNVAMIELLDSLADTSTLNFLRTTPNDEGEFPIHLAISVHGAGPMWAGLVQRGANIHVRTLSGETPFLRAISTQNIPAAEFLMANGAASDLEVPMLDGTTPFFFALLFGDLNLTLRILRWIAAIRPGEISEVLNFPAISLVGVFRNATPLEALIFRNPYSMSRFIETLRMVGASADTIDLSDYNHRLFFLLTLPLKEEQTIKVRFHVYFEISLVQRLLWVLDCIQ